MINGFFGQNLQVKNVKSEHYYWILHIRICVGTKFQIKLTTFGLNLGVHFLKKGEYHQLILHIRISLGTKLQYKLTISIFWTKFAQKGYFWCHGELGNRELRLQSLNLLVI